MWFSFMLALFIKYIYTNINMRHFTFNLHLYFWYQRHLLAWILIRLYHICWCYPNPWGWIMLRVSHHRLLFLPIYCTFSTCTYVRYQFQPCNHKFSNISNQFFSYTKIWKFSSKRVFVQFIRVISVLNPFLFWILPFFSQIKIPVILFWGVLRKIILPNRYTLNIELEK